MKMHLGIFCDLPEWLCTCADFLLDSGEQQCVNKKSAEVEHVCACHSDESCDSEESYES